MPTAPRAISSRPAATKGSSSSGSGSLRTTRDTRAPGTTWRALRDNGEGLRARGQSDLAIVAFRDALLGRSNIDAPSQKDEDPSNEIAGLALHKRVTTRESLAALALDPVPQATGALGVDED